jgi:dihydrofolate reductase
VISLYIAQSLDGYIAGPHGELGFLDKVEDPEHQEDYGYAAFYATVEVLVMGRKTWDFVASTGTWHYHGKESWVLTRQTGLQPLADERFTAFDAQQWRDAGRGRHVWVAGGGEVNRLFLEHGLFDRLVLSTLPVLLGEGLPCFPAGFPASDWKLASTRTYPSGLLQTVHVRA